MKRRILVFLCAVAFMAVAVAPALGDTEPSGPGPTLPPGDTFPEQSGIDTSGFDTHNGCYAITHNEGTMPDGVFDQHVPTFVNNQTTDLLIDACFGG